MKHRQPDALAAAVYGNRDTRPAGERVRKWKRTGLPIAAAIAIVIVIAVITDLPTNAPLSAQEGAASSLVTEVNNDLTPCVFSINEANTLYRDERAGTLTAADRARVPSLLGDDAAACSFTSDNVNDLADIEEPGTGAGKWLSQVVALAQTWTTSDALGAIDDLINLTANPKDQSAKRDLADRQRFLTSDRQAALAAETGADHYLKGRLPALDLPKVILPS